MRFRSNTYTAEAGEDGKWEMTFNPGAAGGPDSLEVGSSSGGKIVLDDIYIGELWLCSGQSNMQLQMNRLKYAYPEEYERAADPMVRFFTVPVRYAFEPLEDLDGGCWLPADSKNLDGISGSSYFMAQKLHSLTGVPVGIINASQGGSPITAWMNENDFQVGSIYLEKLDACRNPAVVDADRMETADRIRRWHEDVDARDEGLKDGWKSFDGFMTHKDWETFGVPGSLGKCGDAGIFWISRELFLTEEEIAVLEKEKVWLWLGRITDSDEAFVNGISVGSTGYMYPPRRYVVPSGILHAGKNIISIRVCLGGRSGPLLFEKEKPYVLFTDNVLKCAWRKALLDAVCNSEAERKDAAGKGYVCINLAGPWKCRTGCRADVCPGEHFYEWEPSALYNGMLHPLKKVAFRGAVWYQGESNAAEPENYSKLLVSMVERWRKDFRFSPLTEKGGRLPFVMAELPLTSLRCAAPDYAADADGCRKWLNTSADYEFTGMEDCWVSFRKMQARMAEIIPDTALASFYGAGEWNDLHPEDKKTAGSRMAEAAFSFIQSR